MGFAPQNSRARIFWEVEAEAVILGLTALPLLALPSLRRPPPSLLPTLLSLSLSFTTLHHHQQLSPLLLHQIIITQTSWNVVREWYTPDALRPAVEDVIRAAALETAHVTEGVVDRQMAAAAMDDYLGPE